MGSRIFNKSFSLNAKQAAGACLRCDPPSNKIIELSTHRSQDFPWCYVSKVEMSCAAILNPWALWEKLSKAGIKVLYFNSRLLKTIIKTSLASCWQCRIFQRTRQLWFSSRSFKCKVTGFQKTQKKSFKLCVSWMITCEALSRFGFVFCFSLPLLRNGTCCHREPSCVADVLGNFQGIEKMYFSPMKF